MSGNAREGHKQSAIDAGMDMVFVKVSAQHYRRI
jgi:hypothetical protein